jgi:hypothetical protein
MEYLRRKWAIWFKSLDSNQDGKLTEADMMMSAEKFKKIREKMGDNATGGKEVDIEKWWNTYIFRRGPRKELSSDEFIAALGESYLKDKTAFRQEMERCFTDLSVFMTDNKVQPISEEIFNFGFQVYGQEDSNQVAKAYKLFDQPTVQRIVDAWVQFITDDNEIKQDVIKEAFGNPDL